jgi:drug/metabolite transporter superfamily protein YnfA
MKNIKKNISLIISVFIAVPIGIIYGYQPNLLFDIQLQTIYEHNVFKAIMGLFLGFSLLWILGIFKNNLWQVAIISNFIFMLGLAFGRITSLIFDGIPSLLFVLGTLGELILGFYSFWIWKKQL